MPVVNCSYVVRADVIADLGYADDSVRHDYVVFAEAARRQGIPQYLDNRQVYGYVVRRNDSDPAIATDLEHARRLLAEGAVALAG